MPSVLNDALHAMQVPAFTKLRRQGQLSMRDKIKYEYRMMTTAFSGHLPILTADPVQPQVCLSTSWTFHLSDRLEAAESAPMRLRSRFLSD